MIYSLPQKGEYILIFQTLYILHLIKLEMSHWASNVWCDFLFYRKMLVTYCEQGQNAGFTVFYFTGNGSHK